MCVKTLARAQNVRLQQDLSVQVLGQRCYCDLRAKMNPSLR
jgi:hypothetical protein